MNAKTLTGLAIAAAVVVGAAVYMRGGSGSSTAVASEDALLPELAAAQRVNDVAEVRVVRNSGTYTLKKAGDGWTIAEKGGYPVETAAVRKALLVLRDMKRLEKKTADPARHAQLDLADPKAEGSKAVQVDLVDGAGATVASFLVGKQLEQKGSFESKQTYVRRAGEDQCWLVRGKAEFHEQPSEWMDKKIVEVKRDRVAKVSIVHPDGETYDISRPSKDVADFALEGIPEGKEPTYAGAPGSVASALEWVNLEDVAPASTVDFASGAGPKAVFTTFDGVVVTVTTKDQDGKSWAKFEASYVAPAAVGPAPAPKEGEAAPEDPAKVAEAAKAEAEKLQQKLGSWAYQISSYSRANFGKKKAEVLKDKNPPAGVQDGAQNGEQGGGILLPQDGATPPAPADGSHVHADGTVHEGPAHDGEQKPQR